MCCRFQIEPDQPVEREELEKVLTLMDRHYPGAYKTGEINPADTAPAFAGREGKIGPVLGTFGIPLGKKLLLNARSETVREKPFFAESFERRRLVLPATGFFEWRRVGGRAKEKYLFTVPGVPLFYLAALYVAGEGRCRFAILTRPAAGVMEEIHDRMPLLLRPRQVRSFLTQEEEAVSLLTAPPLELNKTLQSPVTPEQLSFRL